MGNILSYLNPFSDNFFGYKIINLFSDLFKELFVPSEERLTAISNTVSSKFEFVDNIKTAISSLQNIINNVGNAPKLDINIGATKYTSAGTVTLDMSFYKPYKSYGDLVLTGFIYLFFLWRLFIRLPSIIRGDSGYIVDVEKIQRGGKR